MIVGQKKRSRRVIVVGANIRFTFLALIFMVFMGTLWRQHIVLKMDVLHPRQDVNPPNVKMSFGRSTNDCHIATNNQTMATLTTTTSVLHLEQITPRIKYHQCQIMNTTISIPQIPHFLIVGAQKAGTTAILEFLKQHPDFQSSKDKEPHFFDWHYPSRTRRNYWYTEHGLPWNLSKEENLCAIRRAYTNYFNLSMIGSQTIVFEKTPGYLFLNEVPERIATTLFWKPKIVAILRNPIDRAISNYRMKITTYGRSFEEIIDEEMTSLIDSGLSHAPKRNETDLSDNDDIHHRFEIPKLPPKLSEELHWKHYRKIHHCNYIQRGMYAQQLERWLRYFPIDKDKPNQSSILVLKYEEFKAYPERVFARLLEFLGATPFIPTDGFSTMHNYHPERKEQMLPETRRYLSKIFRPYNELLVNMLGDEWKGVWDETGTA